MGRFISADSLIPSPANPQSLNRYSYVYNNPINATDPSGHCIFGIDTILCAIALGAAIGAAADYGYQVYQNHQQGMELGAALTTDIDLLEIAAVGGGSAVGAGIGWVATPFLFGVGSAVCADGDCTNEANTVADSAKKISIEYNETNIRPAIEYAIKEIENSGLRPGQDVIYQSKILRLVQDFDILEARSSIYKAEDGVRYLYEGHHTTIASMITGKTGPFMDQLARGVPELGIYWTRQPWEIWKEVIQIKP